MNDAGAPGGSTPRWSTIAALGTSQTLAWASTYYLPAVLAAPMARELGVSVQLVFAAFSAALVISALLGPYAGRLLELGVLRHFHPFLSARLAAVMHPIGAAVFALAGAPGAAAFALLHGAGNGILTIANGTLPLVLFGPHGYGQRQSRLTRASRLAQAMAPWLFGLCLDRWGVGALWISASLGLASLAALLALPKHAAHVRRTEFDD